MQPLSRDEEVTGMIVDLVLRSISDCGVDLIRGGPTLEKMKCIFAEARLLTCYIRREQYRKILAANGFKWEPHHN